jgi:pimeloyl-ACP methyl ester carboxylesterase
MAHGGIELARVNSAHCERLVSSLSFGLIVRIPLARRATVLVVAALLAVAVPATLSAQSGTNSLRIEPYPLKTADGQSVSAELGRLRVPARYGRPNEAHITIAFVRLRGSGATGSPPIVYLAGGPGTSGIAVTRGGRFNAIRDLTRFGDVILLDQRGTGLSRPLLECPTVFRYPHHLSVDQRRMTSKLRAFANRCAGALRKRGIDLSAYTTENSADDLAALAAQLGVNQLRLGGESYGTHLGLAVLRRHPTLVERAVLIGVEGPDQTLKLPAALERHLDDVSALIAADPEAGRVLPAYKSQLARLLGRMQRAPANVATRDIHRAGKTTTIRLTAFDVRQVAVALLGRQAGIELIPWVFGPAMHGDFSRIAAFAIEDVRAAPITVMGALIDCASLASPPRLRTITRQSLTTVLGGSADYPLPDWCGAWGVASLSAAFRAPIHSDVPVLLVAGTLDGLTPVSNALEVRRGLTRAVLFTIEGGAHDTLVNAPAVRLAIGEFLSGHSLTDTVFAAAPIVFKPIEKLP